MVTQLKVELTPCCSLLVGGAVGGLEHMLKRGCAAVEAHHRGSGSALPSDMIRIKGHAWYAAAYAVGLNSSSSPSQQTTSLQSLRRELSKVGGSQETEQKVQVVAS
jgi:hypothetical protein